MNSRRPAGRGNLLGGVLALLLIAVVIVLAEPARVADLLTNVAPKPLALALGAAAGSLVFRAVRLSLLLPPGHLGLARSVPVAAVAQAAASFVPARLGELVLVWLLKRDHGRDGAWGVATLLVARTLDTAVLGAWAGVAILARWGFGAGWALVAALSLLTPLVLIPLSIGRLDRWMCSRQPGMGPTATVWADRIHRVRQGLDDARARPGRLIGATIACVVFWAFQWTLAFELLVAMGFRWPVVDVVTGSAVASVSNVLPINLIANLGTLEAGWTAAFAAMGIPVQVAAATGLACHLWALVFAAVFGVIGWIVLSLLPEASLDGVS